MAKTLYNYWFVQFDFPNAKGEPYKSSGGKMVYSEELKREIPEGWEAINIDKEIHILNGYAFQSKDYVEKGTFVLRTKNFNNDFIVEFQSDDVFLPNSFKDKYKSFLCKAYDYHLVMVGASVGKRGLIYPHHLPALRNQNMWCFRANSESIIRYAFNKQLLDALIQKLSSTASGSARDFFTKDNFKREKFCLPNEKILNKYEKIAFPIMQLQSKNSAETQTLKAQRDFLLPMLMNGQVNVK